MLFPSEEFLFLFLPIVLFVYYAFLRKTTHAKNIFLLIVSLYFYVSGGRDYLPLILFVILINWLFGLLVDWTKEKTTLCKLLLAVDVVINLGVLGRFKYTGFVIDNLNRFAHTNLINPGIILPIGISFFTFQAMSYTIDVYRGRGQVQKNPLNVGLYIAFFPQLIAGPIVRYETIAQQIAHREENLEDFTKGVCRFIIGLGKKVLIANNMGLVADTIFGTISGSAFHASAVAAWLGAISYTLQIFFDFSGYSDMAIGLGQMFGFHFEENFNYPYIAKSVSEFWRRWHISLQTWFRDYVYFPMGGSRVKSKARLVFNLFVVWSLIRNLRFLVSWGVLTLLFAVIYSYVPSVRQKFLYQLPGAAFSAIVWSIFSFFFSVYIKYFNGFSTYGSLTTIIIILLWMYFCFYIIMIGAFLNRYFAPAIR